MSQSRVFIGHLSSRASERDVEHFFRGYGRIRDIVLKNGFGFVQFDDDRDADDAIYELNGKDLAGERVILEFSRRGPRERDRGYGDRDRSGGRHGGRDSGRDHGRGGRQGGRFGPPTQTRHRMLVENLSTGSEGIHAIRSLASCDEDSKILLVFFVRSFSEGGGLQLAGGYQTDLKDMMRNAGEVTYADAHKTRRNEAIVCFASRDDLLRAIEKYQGKDLNGREIKLIDDSEKRSRSRSKSKSRSRSRSRSPRSASRSGSRSRSRSRSKSDSRDRKSRSRSGSPAKKEKEESRSRSRSHSRD
ncbi:unnamed protein product, partial [Mesorhabditis belari]|uniref:RRM domain-containing protein n=1 Tax=Mesorhabditis belari TaxID=2138241 RepID=A0AAF3EW95_9BILA